MKIFAKLFILLTLTNLTSQVILSRKKNKGRKLLTFAGTEKRKQRYESERCKLKS